MNLSQGLHAQWAANATLNGLLPATSLQTGTLFAVEPAKPYAILARPEGNVSARMNDGHRIDTVGIRFTVYHGADNYDEGVAIADAVDDAFDKLAFDLGGGDRVISMMIDGPPGESQNEEGNWSWDIDFTCMIQMAA